MDGRTGDLRLKIMSSAAAWSAKTAVETQILSTVTGLPIHKRVRHQTITALHVIVEINENHVFATFPERLSRAYSKPVFRGVVWREWPL